MFNDVWLVALEDGSTQVTYDGRPLCYWQRDTEARQATGHGFNDIWWVVDVSGSLPAAESPRFAPGADPPQHSRGSALPSVRTPVRA